MLTASIQNARLIAERLVDGYGRRAMEAEHSDGLDWKVLSHAVRIGQEAVELFRTGQITFPRPEAAHLLAVKQGKIPYAEVAEEIESLVDEVETAASDSGFPDQADMQVVDDLVFRVYRKRDCRLTLAYLVGLSNLEGIHPFPESLSRLEVD